MKIVFVTNLVTPHQIPLINSFYTITNGSFCVIETSKANKDLPIGWKTDFKSDYIITSTQYFENKAESIKIINQADFVIFGSAPDECVADRIKNNKITFRYSERLYKPKYKSNKLKEIYSAWLHHGQFQKHNLYMLCASAYTPIDCKKHRNYINKTYKWGYFPEVKKYDSIETVIENKEPSSILWAGRLIDWKHPEHPIQVAKKLKEQGYKFHLNIIGNGELEEQLLKMINDEDLNDYISMLGSMSPDKVREYMEKSQIFMFTSDFNEGWGAVLNESMNSGCVVVASHAIGSVPYLLQDNINGLIYKNGDIDDLFNKVKYLLENPQKYNEFGKAAYKTLNHEWNADVATERFLQLANSLQNGNKDTVELFESGPCSKAEILENGWFDL